MLPDATRARLEDIRMTLQFTLGDQRRLAAIRGDHLAETLDIADTLLAMLDAQAPIVQAAAAWADAVAADPMELPEAEMVAVWAAVAAARGEGRE